VKLGQTTTCSGKFLFLKRTRRSDRHTPIFFWRNWEIAAGWVVRVQAQRTWWPNSPQIAILQSTPNNYRLPLLSHLLRSAWATLGLDSWCAVSNRDLWYPRTNVRNLPPSSMSNSDVHLIYVPVQPGIQQASTHICDQNFCVGRLNGGSQTASSAHNYKI